MPSPPLTAPPAPPVTSLTRQWCAPPPPPSPSPQTQLREPPVQAVGTSGTSGCASATASQTHPMRRCSGQPTATPAAFHCFTRAWGARVVLCCAVLMAWWPVQVLAEAFASALAQVAIGCDVRGEGNLCAAGRAEIETAVQVRPLHCRSSLTPAPHTCILQPQLQLDKAGAELPKQASGCVHIAGVFLHAPGKTIPRPGLRVVGGWSGPARSWNSSWRVDW